MKFESFPKTIESEEQPKAYTEIKQKLEAICQTYSSPADRVDLILNKVKLLLRHIDHSIVSEEQAQTVCDKIEASVIIENQAEFVISLLDALKPIIDLKIKDFGEFEKSQIEAINDAHGWNKLNQLLSYGKSGPTIHLHVPAGESVSNKRDQYYEGLAKLAEIIEKDPEIQRVEATSFIVAKHPGLFVRDNFIISEVTKEFKQKYFPGEIKEIKRASISREDFLNKFLPKNN